MYLNSLWESFKSHVQELTNKFVPLRRIKEYKRIHEAWFTRNVGTISSRRRKAYRTFYKNNSPSNQLKLETLTKQYKKLVKGCKREYFIQLNNKLQSRAKEFCRFLKSNKKVDSSIPPLSRGDNLLVDDVDKTSWFNSYFKSGFNIKRNVNCEEDVSSGVMQVKPPVEISVSGIRSLLRNLSTIKAMGTDVIAPAVLNACSDIIARYFHIIFKKKAYWSILYQKTGRQLWFF